MWLIKRENWGSQWLIALPKSPITSERYKTPSTEFFSLLHAVEKTSNSTVGNLSSTTYDSLFNINLTKINSFLF